MSETPSPRGRSGAALSGRRWIVAAALAALVLVGFEACGGNSSGACRR